MRESHDQDIDWRVAAFASAARPGTWTVEASFINHEAGTVWEDEGIGLRWIDLGPEEATNLAAALRRQSPQLMHFDP